MIISSGQMKVLKNKNKTAKFFGKVEVGDVIEVRANLNVYVTRRVSDKLITVHNLTKGTSRTDAPIYLNSGLEKMTLEPVKPQDDTEYQRGYQDAVGELQSAYIGGYIEDYFREDEDEYNGEE